MSKSKVQSMVCDKCQASFNAANLDEVLFHSGDHTPIVATGIIGHQVEDTVSIQKLSSAHRTTMTQNQRKELLRITLMMFEGEEPMLTLEQVASMSDRQLSLTWLRACDYITEGQFQREFDACIGAPVFGSSGKAEENPDNPKIDGHRVRFLRYGKGLTQDQLATVCTCSKRTIERAEDSLSIHPHHVAVIASALGVDPKEILQTGPVLPKPLCQEKPPAPLRPDEPPARE